ncbi:MAG: response regulator, partial [Lentisphaeraceae bacterium]|nr:response regulator [Lentisphaeraceae bacterium]
MSARLLIIDDMPQTLNFLSLRLKKAGFEVCAAGSFQDALAILESDDIDLILMDVVMPEVNGYDACEYLKKETSFSSIPVIFVTSCDAEEDIHKCFDVGGVDYVNKNSSQRELLVRIKTQLKLVESNRRQFHGLSQFFSALDAFPHDITVLYPDGRIIFMNHSALNLCERQKKYNHRLDIPVDEARLLGCEVFDQVLNNKEASEHKKTFAGIIRHITVVPVIDELCNESEFHFMISRDITDEDNIERHLRQTRQMEARS